MQGSRHENNCRSQLREWVQLALPHKRLMKPKMALCCLALMWCCRIDSCTQFQTHSIARSLLQQHQPVSGANMVGGDSVISTVLNATKDGGFLVVRAQNNLPTETCPRRLERACLEAAHSVECAA